MLKQSFFDLNGPYLSFIEQPVGVTTTNGGPVTLVGIATASFKTGVSTDSPDAPDNPAVGSGSLSKLWRQIQADVFNLPVTVVNQFAGPAYGAAILAAVGQKSFSSINEVVELWTNFETSSEPNSEVVSNYDKYYSVYRNIYPSVKASFQEINSLTT